MAERDAIAKTIMIAEDYDDTRAMLKQYLEGQGYKVIEATNGEEAVELALRLRPDLILMDLHMPKVDGVAALRHIRETQAIPIITNSGFGARAIDLYNRIDELPGGAIEYLAKPIDLEELQYMLDRFLRPGR
jgi:CheY-like chemotaxis protein